MLLVKKDRKVKTGIHHLKNFCGSSDRGRTRKTSIIRHANALYTEEWFRNLLVLERKRTERTNRPFMLMLVDVSRLRATSNGMAAVERLAASLYCCTRDTDIKGWFVADSVIGIVFLDFPEASTGTITGKVTDTFSSLLSPEQQNTLEISRFIFPDNGGNGTETGVDVNSIFYDNRRGTSTRVAVSLFCKRCIDIAGSIAGIVIFAPLLLLMPVVIKCTSRGSVFFRQERIGQFGRKFILYKFRTMRQNNDCQIHKEFVKKFIRGPLEGSGFAAPAVFKIKNDPRVTGIGRLLRMASLDELPQFFNVLLGDMSLVGPRPALAYEVEEYAAWHRRRVLEVKPGITGVWQVKGRSRTDFDNMVRMDIGYIKSRSLLMDVRLILATPYALISARGAY